MKTQVFTLLNKKELLLEEAFSIYIIKCNNTDKSFSMKFEIKDSSDKEFMLINSKIGTHKMSSSSNDADANTDPDTVPNTTPTPKGDSKQGGRNAVKIAGGVVGALVVVAIIVVVIFLIVRKKKNQEENASNDDIKEDHSIDDSTGV